MKLFGKSSELQSMMPRVRGQLEFDVPMARYSWLGVGGPASVLFIPADVQDLSSFLQQYPRELPLTILGGCSNVLIRDGGISGITVLIGRSFSSIHLEDGQLTVGAGLRNPELVKWTVDHEITGFEFLSGIPGSIGGGIKMNAGAYGSEIKDILLSASVLDDTGQQHTILKEDINFSYRSSFFPLDWIVVSATFKAEKGNGSKIIKTLSKMREQREATQPTGVRTAGSTFKNVAGVAAWQLIDKAGCRGLTVGGAQISEKHANFMINLGNATAADFENLGELVRQRVLQVCGLRLEWEVKRIGVK